MSKSKHVYLVGTENEHAFYDTSGVVTRSRILGQMKTHAASLGLCSDSTMWGTNGCRAYGEVYEKLEYAGPECRTGREAMLYEVAGSLFWALMALRADQELERHPMTWIFKTNTSELGASAGGNHINLSMPLGGLSFADAFDADVEYLKPFVTTLQIITGAGVVVPKDYAQTLLGGGNYNYAISPRGMHVTIDAKQGACSNSDEGNKPIFMKRDEPLADRDLMYRHQISGLDSNINPGVLQFKLDLLLLMARLSNSRAYKPLSIVEPSGWEHTSRRISLNWRAELYLKSGRVSTPLEVQQYYLRQARDYVKARPNPVHKKLLDQWAWYLRKLDTPEDLPEALFGQLDWVTKGLMIQRMEQKHEKVTYKMAETRHFMYQAYRFNRQGLCVPLRLMRRYGPPGLLGEVWRAMKQPPNDTRASARGRFIQAGVAKSFADWTDVKVDGNGVRLMNPSEPTTTTFEAFMARLENKAA